MKREVKRLYLPLLFLLVASPHAVASADFRQDKCGLFALAFCFHLLSPDQNWSPVLMHRVVESKGVSIWEMVQIAEAAGFDASPLQCSLDQLLANVSPATPAIIHDSSSNHYWVCVDCHENQCLIVDAIKAESKYVGKQELGRLFDGNVIFIAKRGDLPGGLNRDPAGIYFIAAALILIVAFFFVKIKLEKSTTLE